jgi:hypothetical protein
MRRINEDDQRLKTCGDCAEFFLQGFDRGGAYLDDGVKGEGAHI